MHEQMAARRDVIFPGKEIIGQATDRLVISIPTAKGQAINRYAIDGHASDRLPINGKQCYRFEDFVLDADRRELMRGSVQIAIGPQVFDLLLHLIDNRQQVVTKDNLIAMVWKGRIVSDSTLTSQINAVRNAIGDTGESQHLVRTISRKGYRFIGDVTEVAGTDSAKPPRAAEAQAPFPTLTHLPSVAILPFLNLSGDPAQDYFVDGVVEDLISALSRMHCLFVISRNSSFTYKGRAINVQQVGRELGVRYVLEGSVRKAANRIRIIGQLVDATSGITLWSGRFDGEVTDVFEVQDQLTAKVVGSLAPQIERAEIERARLKPTNILAAYDYYLRGMAAFHQGTRQGIDDALPLFYMSIERDPTYGAAYGMAAWCFFWRKLNGWMIDQVADSLEAARLARRAIELSRDDAAVLTRGGHALGHFGGDLDSCIELLDRALILNPNLATTWYLSAFQRISNGKPEEALERFAHAMRLSPLDPEMVRIQAGMAMAYLFSGDFDTATNWAEEAYRRLPGFLLVICIVAASHALAGRDKEASRAVADLRELKPDLRVSHLNDWVLLRRAQDLARLAEGLQRAGLPA